MAVGCNALNSIQLVAGCDMHFQIPPPPPAGPVPAPHVVVYMMGLAMPSTSKQSRTVKAGWGSALGRQHDLGMGIHHFAANALLPLVWLGGANKAEFGSGTVSIDVKGDATRMAVAVVPIVGINTQLDCNDVPCALPTSICIASLNTVHVGFSLGDFIGGLIAGAVDVGISYLVSKVVGTALPKGLMALLGKSTTGIRVMLVVGIVSSRFPRARRVVEDGIKMNLGWCLGTPLGYSHSWAPGSNYGGKINDGINDWTSGTVDSATRAIGNWISPGKR